MAPSLMCYQVRKQIGFHAAAMGNNEDNFRPAKPPHKTINPEPIGIAGPANIAHTEMRPRQKMQLADRNAVRIRLGKDELKVSSSSVEIGESEDTVETAYSG